MPFADRPARRDEASGDGARAARRFAFVSTCPELWGGSEELWSGAAAALAERGHRVAAYKTGVDARHPSLMRLKALSCPVRNLPSTKLLPLPVVLRVHMAALASHVVTRRPDLLVISQGDNHDGLYFANLGRRLGLPYALISQKAADHFWPRDDARADMRELFRGAARCFFVSEHNRRLTEDQIGIQLPNAEVVRNPYLVQAEGALPWPGGEDECLRLACVARLFLLDKGQDIILRVLAREKWRARALRISFYGRGINAESLSEFAAKLGLRSVSFEGQTADVTGIWRGHHALVLASRAEGLPLALVEAMMCGRPAVVTKVGGSAEVVEEGVTGFLAEPSEDSLDAALEKLWARRRGLREMGLRAAERIRGLVPPDPAGELADRLLEIADACALDRKGRAAGLESGRSSEA